LTCTQLVINNPNPKGNAMTQILEVRGMTCGHCERAVTRAVRAVDPQAEVRIDRTAHRVEIANPQADPLALAAAIRAEGYEVAE